MLCTNSWVEMYLSPRTVLHPPKFFALAALQLPNLTQLSRSGAAGHASLPPLNQIRLSNILYEYLISPHPLPPVSVI